MNVLGSDVVFERTTAFSKIFPDERLRLFFFLAAVDVDVTDLIHETDDNPAAGRRSVRVKHDPFFFSRL